ncbi:DUF6998 domain-containing protein [Tranquillimonas alkanivorans]|uniref:DUF6998 domain-containing protein n=1 Tax=Tranquillimonas alkanivorans TaxID=441119 RepID=A0A1I5TMW2_9RHOB|nr:hypothetical protein [Tranquillimonas alkanivorans]SFP83957.1 hypothetical protein SAMN04488047_11419 [Tranquillimonas alkanivorans]
MPLSQVQIIQSLAEALAWFEKELAWGVSPGELTHLTGRIGELYAAMTTRGQMALATNQHGYDVASADNERISVKTVTSSSHVDFNAATFDLVDRVIVLRINIDDGEAAIEELLDCPAEEARQQMRESGRKYVFSISARRSARQIENLRIVAAASYASHTIRQYENGTILVDTDGRRAPSAKPILRTVAAEIGVDLLNGSGNPKNTRQLGADLIRLLQERQAAGS